MKICLRPLAIRETKIKIKGNIATHLSEWLNLKKKKIVITPNTGEDVENLDLSNIARGNVRWHSHSGEKLAVFYKAAHMLKMFTTV